MFHDSQSLRTARGDDRATAYLLPPSVDEWLPSDHLARFVVEVIDRLDLDDLTKQYAGRGSAAHHPAVLPGLLIYGYANGVHSSRKIERASYDSVALRYAAANTHPRPRHAPSNASRPSSRSSRPSRPSARSSATPARSRAARSPSRPRPSPKAATRST